MGSQVRRGRCRPAHLLPIAPLFLRPSLGRPASTPAQRASSARQRQPCLGAVAHHLPPCLPPMPAPLLALPHLPASAQTCPPLPADFTILNAGAFPANRFTSFMTSPTSIDVSLKHREMVSEALGLPACPCACACGVQHVVCGVRRAVWWRGPPRVPGSRPARPPRLLHPAHASLAISLPLAHPCALAQVILGTQYAGEMKKGVFSLMNYMLPKVGRCTVGCAAVRRGCNG